MPLLVIFRNGTGEIISSSVVSKNHSSGNFPPKIRRLLKHADELGLRYIFVEDHIKPQAHVVQQTNTGFSVVRREESDPLYLDPLLALVGEIPEEDKSLTRVRYVTPAGANPEYVRLQPGITIFVPLQGRWYCGVDFFNALARLEKPSGVDVGLTLYDNSLDPTFGSLCKWFLAGVEGYAATNYICDRTPKAKSGASTVEAVARIYGRMTHTVDTEYVLTLEDDVIPLNSNILVELYNTLTHRSGASAAAANVIERNDHKTMCWDLIGEVPMIKYENKTNSVQQVAGVSFSCTLWQMRMLKMIAIKPQRQHERSFLATDITLCADIRDRGSHCLMCWDLHCAHVEPHHQYNPIREDPLFEVKFRRPTTRKDVAQSTSKLLKLPETKARRGFLSLFPQKEVPKVIDQLIIWHVRQDVPPQFIVNLSYLSLPDSVTLVVYGATDPDLWVGHNVQFVDDWEVLSVLIKAAKRIVWWDARVVLHYRSALKLLEGESFLTTDLPDEDSAIEVTSRCADVWACDNTDLPKEFSDLPDFTSQLFAGTAEVLDVKGSRWVPAIGMWIPDDGYRPADLPIRLRTPVNYYGDQVVEKDDWELDLSIAVTCVDQPEVTEQAIESLLETTSHLKREIMVWDNASGDPKLHQVLQKYKEHPVVQIFESQTNRGYIYPMNYMSKKARGRYLVVSNNDIVAHKGWFEALKRPFEEDPLVAQSGPSPEYGFLSDDFLGGPGEGDPDYLEGFFFMVPQWVLARHKLFDDERLVFATCEDADLSLRLREVGYKITACPDANIKHLRSLTRKTDDKIRKRMDETEALNRKYALARWDRYLKTKSFPQYSILVHRKGANGDLLVCEAALKGLRWKFPRSRITLITECVNIMRDCPWVDEVRLSPEPGVEYSKVIELDGAYEKDLGQGRPRIVCEKAQVPFVKPGYWTTPGAAEFATKRFGSKDPVAVLHWRASWENRNWPRVRWLELAKRLSRHFYIVEIGSQEDERLEFGEEFYGKPWEQVTALIKLAKVVVCPDTVSLHIGIGVQTPAVCLYGPTRPELVHDSPYNFSVTVDGLDCLGCHHKPPMPKTTGICEQPHHYCMDGLDVCPVYNKVLQVTGIKEKGCGDED